MIKIPKGQSLKCSECGSVATHDDYLQDTLRMYYTNVGQILCEVCHEEERERNEA